MRSQAQNSKAWVPDSLMAMWGCRSATRAVENRDESWEFSGPIYSFTNARPLFWEHFVCANCCAKCLHPLICLNPRDSLSQAGLKRMELVTEIWWQEGLLIQKCRTKAESCVSMCKREYAERMLAICNTRWPPCSKVPTCGESAGESSYLGGNKRRKLQRWFFDGLYDTLQRQIRDVWDVFLIQIANWSQRWCGTPTL